MERAEPSPRIAVTWPFNLNNVRAVVRQELGAEGGRQRSGSGPSTRVPVRACGGGTVSGRSNMIVAFNIAGRMSFGQ